MFDVKKHITEKNGVFRFTCPVCSKTIESLYPGQVEQNAYVHMGTHNNQEVATKRW